MKNNQIIEEIWKQQISTLMRKMNWIKYPFIIGHIILVVLNFIGIVPFFMVLLYTFVCFGLILWILYHEVLCPNCSTPLLTLQGLKEAPKCVQCGLYISDEKEEV